MKNRSRREQSGLHAVLFTIFGRLSSPWILGIADQVALGAATFLCGLIVARTTSPEQFGLFTLGMTVILLLQDIQGSLVSTPQAIRSPEFADKSLSLFTGSTLVHQLVLSALSIGALTLITASLSTMGAEQSRLPPVLYAVALFGIFTLLREYCRRLCLLRGWMARVMVFDVGIAVSQLVALVAIAYFGWATASLAHVAIGVVCAGFAVSFLFGVKDQFRFSKTALWPDFKANTRIGGWLLFSSLSWTLGAYAYPWLLAMTHGTAETGIFAACMSVIAIVNIALAGILNVLTPNIARARAEGGVPALRRYVFRSCRNYVGFALALATIPILFGEPLITLIYGSAYRGTQIVISLLALNAVLGAVTGPFGRGLMVMGYAKWDFAFNLGTLVFVFTLGWWSVAVFGTLGAAFSLTVANGLGALLRLIAFERVSRAKSCVKDKT